MDKLKELVRGGWVITSCYREGVFYVVASRYAIATKTAFDVDLELAIFEIYKKCTEGG